MASAGDAARSYWYAVKDRVRAHPEVEDAAIVTAAPLGGRVNETNYNATPGIRTMSQSVDPEYFATMRIPLLSGRVFGAGDQKTAIVSRRLALAMYGTLDVLGREFPKSGTSEATIIGVAGDAHSIKVEANNVAELYLPLTPEDFSLVYPRSAGEDRRGSVAAGPARGGEPRPARHPDREGDARGLRPAHAGPAPGEHDRRRHRRC